MIAPKHAASTLSVSNHEANKSLGATQFVCRLGRLVVCATT